MTEVALSPGAWPWLAIAAASSSTLRVKACTSARNWLLPLALRLALRAAGLCAALAQAALNACMDGPTSLPDGAIGPVIDITPAIP